MGRMRWTALALGAALLVGPAGAATAASKAPAKAAKSAVEVLAQAPVATISGKTAKVAMDMDFSFTAQGKKVGGAMHVDGAVDFSGARMAMTMDMTDFMRSIAKAAGPAAEKELSKLGDFSYDIRMAQRIMYMRMPKIAMQALGSTKSWIKVDLALLGADASVAGSMTGQSGGPYDALTYLGGVSSTGLKTVGREKVRGTETTHYSGTIDLAKAIQESEKLRKQLGGAGPDAATLRSMFGSSTIPFDAWVDDAGRLRKQSLPVQFSQQGMTGAMTIVSEYYDFGAEIQVPVPPAADTVDASTIPSLWSQLKVKATSAKR